MNRYDKQAVVLISNIESMIHLVRGQKVMLGADLAKIYGVTPARLHQQFNRNPGRFPEDFAFQLTKTELENLMLQNATSKPGRGGYRKLPFVFTEHGALMLASVLNSPLAIAASVRVMRAFTKMREMLAANKELAIKFTELEKRLDGHDESIANLFEAIRQLLEPPDTYPKPGEIGFHVKDGTRAYRVRAPKIK